MKELQGNCIRFLPTHKIEAVPLNIKFEKVNIERLVFTPVHKKIILKINLANDILA